MSLSDVKYDAFISYRHKELDMAVARTIQKKLENFKLPGSLKGKTAGGKTKITRVFRDQDELPLASNLSDPITEALSNAEYLIVICTPDLPKSQWCAKEIETFIAMHGRERVLAVLADGEPDESFPEQLRFDKHIEVDENGEEHEVVREIEPLAAEARGKNASERNKNINDAVIRLAAPMFGLNYDDLKQRHKEQRTKRLMAVSSSVAAVFFVFAMVCMALAFRISAQKSTIEEQYRREQQRYAESMADASMELMQNGLKYDAVYAVRNAMPASLSMDDIPYSAEAERALTNALSLYQRNGIYRTMPEISFENSILAMNVSGNGKYLAARESNDVMHIFNLDDNTETDSFDSNYVSADNESICFVDNESFIAFDYDCGTYRYFIETKEKKILSDDICSCGYSAAAGKYFLADGEYISIFSIEDDSLLNRIYIYGFIDEEYSIGELRHYTLDSSGDYLCASFEVIGQDAYALAVINLKTDDILTNIIVDCDYLNAIIAENYLYLIYYDFSWDITADSSTNLEAYNLINGECVRSVKIPGCMLREFAYNPDGSGRMLLYGPNNYCLINIVYDEGKYVVGEFTEIVEAGYYGGNSIVQFVSSKGSFYIYSFDMNLVNDYSYTYFENKFENTIDNAVVIPGLILRIPSGENYIAVNRFSDNDNWEKVSEIEGSYSGGLSKDGHYCLKRISEAGEYYATVINTVSGEELCKVASGEGHLYMVGDGTEYFMIDGDDIRVYSFSGELIHTHESWKDSYSNNGFACNERYLEYIDYLENGRAYKLINPVNGEEVLNMECGSDVRRVLFADDGEIRYVLVGEKEMSLHRTDSGEAIASFPSIYSNVSQYIVTDDGKYILIVYENNTTQIVSTESLELVNTLYDIQLIIDYAYYYEAIDAYLVRSATYTLVMNADFKIVSEIYGCRAFDSEAMKFVVNQSDTFYYCNYFSYEDKIKIADELLGEYTPSERIKNKYHM